MRVTIPFAECGIQKRVCANELLMKHSVLEGSFQLLVNPRHFRALPGRKTDQKDCEWLAQLLQYGLLRGSFVPPQEIRELLELTRYRAPSSASTS